MEATNDSLFQLMRFNILNSVRVDPDNSPFSTAYVYAWALGVFPALDEADWHKPFPEQFSITKDEVLELHKLLDEKWFEKIPITFYELEKHYGVRNSTHSSSSWTREKLVDVCRYLYLSSSFDNSFWLSLTKSTKCPSEAYSICEPLRESEVCLM